MLRTALMFLPFIFSSSLAQDVNFTLQMTDPRIHHIGSWADGAQTSQIGSSLSLSFNGSALYVFMPKDSAFGDGVIVLDGKSYPWNGFAAELDTTNLRPCGLCITDLDSDIEHNVNVTLTSHGDSTDPQLAYLEVTEIIYTENQTATPGNIFNYPGTSTSGGDPGSSESPSPSPSTSTSSSSPSPTLPMAAIIGGAVGGAVVLLSLFGAIFYLYRRNRQLSAEPPHRAWERPDFPPTQDTGDRGYLQYRERVPLAAASATSFPHSEYDGPYDSRPTASSTQQLLPLAPTLSSAPMSEKQRLAMGVDPRYDNSRTLGGPSSNQATEQNTVPGSEKQRIIMASNPSTTAYPSSSQMPSHEAGDGVQQLQAQVARLAGLIDAPPGYNL